MKQPQLHAVRVPAELSEAAVVVQGDQQRGGSEGRSCGSGGKRRGGRPEEKGGKEGHRLDVELRPIR